MLQDIEPQVESGPSLTPVPGYEFPLEYIAPQYSDQIGLKSEFVDPPVFRDQDEVYRLSQERHNYALDTRQKLQSTEIAERIEAKTNDAEAPSIFNFFGTAGDSYAKKDGSSNTVKGFLRTIDTMVPFIGSRVAASREKYVNDAFQKLVNKEELSIEEMEEIATYAALNENWEKAGAGARVANLAGYSGRFMSEFFAIGMIPGLGPLKAVKTGADAWRGATLFERARRGVKVAAAATALNGSVDEHMQRIMNADAQTIAVSRDQEGELELGFIDVDEDTWQQALPKGILLGFSEAVSEQLGGALVRGIGASGKFVGGAVGKGLAKIGGAGVAKSIAGSAVGRAAAGLGNDFIKKTGLKFLAQKFFRKFPNETPSGFFAALKNRAQWDGLLGEILEERANESMTYVGGKILEEAVGGQPIAEDFGVTQILLDKIRGQETANLVDKQRQVLDELVTFAFYGMGARPLANQMYLSHMRHNWDIASRDPEMSKRVWQTLFRRQNDGRGLSATEEALSLSNFIESVQGDSPSRAQLNNTVWGAFEKQIGKKSNAEQRGAILQGAKDRLDEITGPQSEALQEIRGHVRRVHEVLSRAVGEAAEQDAEDSRDQADEITDLTREKVKEIAGFNIVGEAESLNRENQEIEEDGVASAPIKDNVRKTPVVVSRDDGGLKVADATPRKKKAERWEYPGDINMTPEAIRERDFGLARVEQMKQRVEETLDEQLDALAGVPKESNRYSSKDQLRARGKIEAVKNEDGTFSVTLQGREVGKYKTQGAALLATRLANETGVTEGELNELFDLDIVHEQLLSRAAEDSNFNYVDYENDFVGIDAPNILDNAEQMVKQARANEKSHTHVSEQSARDIEADEAMLEDALSREDDVSSREEEIAKSLEAEMLFKPEPSDILGVQIAAEVPGISKESAEDVRAAVLEAIAFYRNRNMEWNEQAQEIKREVVKGYAKATGKENPSFREAVDDPKFDRQMVLAANPRWPYELGYVQQELAEYRDLKDSPFLSGSLEEFVEKIGQIPKERDPYETKFDYTKTEAESAADVKRNALNAVRLAFKGTKKVLNLNLDWNWSKMERDEKKAFMKGLVDPAKAAKKYKIDPSNDAKYQLLKRASKNARKWLDPEQYIKSEGKSVFEYEGVRDFVFGIMDVPVVEAKNAAKKAAADAIFDEINAVTINYTETPDVDFNDILDAVEEKKRSAAEKIEQQRQVAQEEIKADPVAAEAQKQLESSGKVIEDSEKEQQDADAFFTDKALERAKEGTGYKSREIIVYMAPETFLKLADDFENIDSTTKVKEYEKFTSVPHLTFELDENGVARVVGHEGRHRSREIIRRGGTMMPVVLISQGKNTIRWSEQKSADKFDRIQVDWPKHLKAQAKAADPSFMTEFPVADPLKEKQSEPKQNLVGEAQKNMFGGAAAPKREGSGVEETQSKLFDHDGRKFIEDTDDNLMFAATPEKRNRLGFFGNLASRIFGYTTLANDNVKPKTPLFDIDIKKLADEMTGIASAISQNSEPIKVVTLKEFVAMGGSKKAAAAYHPATNTIFLVKDKLAGKSEAYVRSVIRHEMIHAAFERVLKESGVNRHNFYEGIWNSMTPKEREKFTRFRNSEKLIGDENVESNQGSEVARVVLQKTLYGHVDEMGEFASRSWMKKIKDMFKSTFEWLLRTFDSKRSTDIEISELIRQAGRLVEKYDPVAAKGKFDAAKPDRYEKAATAIYSMMKDKRFDSVLNLYQMWDAIKDYLPVISDGKLNRSQLYEAVQVAVGRLIRDEAEMLSPGNGIHAAKIANAALQKLTSNIYPMLDVEEEVSMRPDVAHAVSVVANLDSRKQVMVVRTPINDLFKQFAELSGANVVDGTLPRPDTDVIYSHLSKVDFGSKKKPPFDLISVGEILNNMKEGSRAVFTMRVPKGANRAFQDWLKNQAAEDTTDMLMNYVFEPEVTGVKDGKIRLVVFEKITKGAQKRGTKNATASSISNDTGEFLDYIKGSQFVNQSPVERPTPPASVPEPTRDQVAEEANQAIENFTEPDSRTGKMFGSGIAKKIRRKIAETTESFAKMFRFHEYIPLKNQMRSEPGKKIEAAITSAYRTLVAGNYVDDKISYEAFDTLLAETGNLIERVTTESRQKLNNIISKLSDEQHVLMSMLLVYRNALRNYDLGKSGDWGHSGRVLSTIVGKLEQMVEAEPEVVDALKARREMMFEEIRLSKEAGLADWSSFQRNLNEEAETEEEMVLEFEMWIHQEVMGIIETSNALRSRVDMIEKGHTQRDEKYDYITNYIAAEETWLTLVGARRGQEQFFNDVAEQYDYRPRLVERANEKNEVMYHGGQERHDEIVGMIEAKVSSKFIDPIDPVGASKRRMQKLQRKINKTWRGKPVKKKDGSVEYPDDNGKRFQSEFTTLKGGSSSPTSPTTLAKIRRSLNSSDYQDVRHHLVEWLEEHNEWKTVRKSMREKEVQRVKRETGRTIKLSSAGYTAKHVLTDPTEKDEKSGLPWRDIVGVYDRSKGSLLWSGKTLADVMIATQISEEAAGDRTFEALLNQHMANVMENEYYFPKPIVKQFNHLHEKNNEGMKLREYSRATLAKIKPLFLLSPSRITGYTVRNFLGDIDSIIANNPQIVRHFKESFNEIIRYWKSHKLNKPSGDLKEAIDRNAIDLFFFETEVPDISKVKEFRKFFEQYEKGGNIASKVAKMPYKIGRAYFDKARDLQNLREATFRLAAYKYYKKNANNPKLFYGSTNKNAALKIKESLGVESMAAKMSRDLLIDYRHLTIAGQRIRDWALPFWSYTERNTGRYVALLDNVIADVQENFEDSKKRAAIIGSIAGLKIGIFYTALNAFNNMMAMLWGIDRDKDLGNFEKSQMYLLLGKTSDGDVLLIRNVGAIAETLSWTPLLDLAGTGSMENYSLVNKAYQSIHPAYKTAVDVVSGQRHYPDVFSPTFYQNRAEAIPANIGMSDLSNEFWGLMGYGTTARRGTLWSSLFGRGLPWKVLGTTNPDQNNLYKAYKIYQDKMKDKGQRNISRATWPNFTRMKHAVVNDDPDAFRRALSAFRANGGDIETFEQMNRNLKVSPASDRYEFYQKLNEEEMSVVKDAEMYIAGIKETMTAWFLQEKGVNKEKFDDIAISKVNVLAGSSPKPGDPKKTFDDENKKQRAFEWLRHNQLEYADARRIYSKKLRELKTPEARRRRMVTFARNWKRLSEGSK